MSASTSNEVQEADMCMTDLDGLAETRVSRKSLLARVSILSLPRKISLASAALYLGIAARGAESASACWMWNCCCLASTNWCGCQGCACSGHSNAFWRVWYCCSGSPSRLYGCGECQSGSGTCEMGPTWYCSYGWLAFNDC